MTKIKELTRRGMMRPSLLTVLLKYPIIKEPIKLLIDQAMVRELR